jgi:hypothetical protein
MRAFVIVIIGLILAALLLGQARADLGAAVSLTVDGGSNLPLNGTTTKLTVGFAGGQSPSQVQLSRDGGTPFATWPTDAFFTLAPNGNSLTATWCISSGCWGGVGGAHILTITAAYTGGLVFTVSIPLNVADGQTATLPVTAGAGPNYPATVIWTGYNWVPVFRVYP